MTSIAAKLAASGLLGIALLVAGPTHASTGAKLDAAAEMARALRDPLATISALMTDNDVLFDTGDAENTSYQFQLQPVHAFDFPEQGLTFIPRAVIPIIGAARGADLPPIGTPGDVTERTWGLGDIVTQFFLAPKVEGGWKFGAGPQLSWKTRTDSALGGADWGAGFAAVATGSITDNLSISPIVGNVWSYDGNFSLMSIQPNIFYNFDFIPGAYVAYTAAITADWKAPSSDSWTLPLGAVIGRTLDLGGHGVDFNVGAYGNAVRPDNGPKWSLKFGVSWLIPR